MADAQLVTLTIEGRQVTVPPGTSILEAAKAAGVLIPHYCYHPGLPVAGVCRMCLVEVEKAPKLAPSCATAVAEGQVVHVHSDKALDARKGVLEMLLINHPLDCPICDQAGECELQDYTFQEGRAESRYLEPKRFNPVEDFGGDVLYVTNRCILCTRGCNSILETRDGVVVRMRPRPNDDVNKYFPCDEGRLDYRWLERRDRVELPYVRNNGALFLLRRLIERTGGSGAYTVRTGPEAPLPGVPDLSLRTDRAANVIGAE